MEVFNNSAQIQTRITILDSNWEKFQAGHEHLLNFRLIDQVRELPYFTSDLYSQCEEKYADIRANMLSMLEQFVHSQPGAEVAIADQSFNYDQGNAYHRSLPKIELPTFNGEYSSWRNFHDVFISMISNSPHLSAVEKFHYLKTSLKGEAAHLVANLPVSNENFIRAWDILVARYENKRLLINTHLDAIFKLQFKSKSAT